MPRRGVTFSGKVNVSGDVPFKATLLTLTPNEHAALKHLSLSRRLAAGHVTRARIILLLAGGRSYGEIQQRLQTTAPTISRWKKRFLERRMQGLSEARHAGRKPTVITPKLEARVLELTQGKPHDGSPHGSIRQLARKLCISKDAVYRIRRKAE